MPDNEKDRERGVWCCVQMRQRHHDRQAGRQTDHDVLAGEIAIGSRREIYVSFMALISLAPESQLDRWGTSRLVESLYPWRVGGRRRLETECVKLGTS